MVQSNFSLTSFALERPSLRRRRRDAPVVRPVVPLFYCGPENRLAGFACKHDVEHLLEVARPLLLVGDPGTGKTSLALHLAQRIGISEVWHPEGDPTTPSISSDSVSRSSTFEVTSKMLSDRVLFQTATDFAREFASSVDSQDMPHLRARLDDVPVWVVDDLHAIADKAAAQDELASRLQARDAAGRVTLITCRRLPSEVRGLRPHLVSRTLPGLTITLHPPFEEARRAVLRELMSAHLPDCRADDLVLLDGGLPADQTVGQLEAAVKQIAMWCRMNNASLCAPAIDWALEHIAGPPSVSVKSITTAVARSLGVKSADMRSGSRRQSIVRARSLAMYLSRQLTDLSLTQIGDAFGGRDHSTVLHAIRKMEACFDDDAGLRRAADEITQRFSA